MAKCELESPADVESLTEEVCDSPNLMRAYRAVRLNKGSPGVDGMTVHELEGRLRRHWPKIREALLAGPHEPCPSKLVEIPKPNGGVRKLGVPAVLDRLVQ